MPVQKVYLLNQNTPVVIPSGLVPKGAYNAGTDYAVGDSVDYNGSSYVMFVDAVAGTLPTDTTKWQVLANKGTTGQGVPTGGTTGQVLSKIDATNYNTQWVDQTGGGGAVDSVNGATGIVVLDQDDVLDGTTYKQYSATEKTKLAGIATGANVGVVPNGAITGATKTKITYDAKGLVTAGADATTADIADSTNKRYVTDANITVIGNTSGTNTGDQTSVTGNAGTATALQTSRNINGVAFNGTANITIADSTKVPYTGATSNVALGANDLSAAGITLTSDIRASGHYGLNNSTAYFGANANTVTDTAGQTTTLAGMAGNGTGDGGDLIIRAGAKGAGGTNDGRLRFELPTTAATILNIAALTGDRNLTMPDADVDLSPVVNLSGTNTGDQDLSSYATTSAVASGYQPLDSDLTTIAGLTATTDNFLVSVSSAWASRTPAQVKTTLSLNNVDNTSNATERAATRTLTNARITTRSGSTASSATPTINTDDYDEYDITALAANITSFTTNLTGTPSNGDDLWIRIKDDGTTRTVAWGASFVASGTAALITNTVVSKTHYSRFRYDSTAAKWVCLASDIAGY